MGLDIEELERIFPAYLLDASKQRLLDCLSNKNANHDYFAQSWDGADAPLQGDGWSTFKLYDFELGEEREVSGIIFSNSCDIDAENNSMRPRNVVFAPFITLETYLRRLTEGAIPADRRQNHIEAIKRQEKTEIFYVPATQSVPECIVMLDDIHSIPLKTFLDAGRPRKKLFRLNNFGFYMFLMKLAIHFTRFGEAIDRDGGLVGAD